MVHCRHCADRLESLLGFFCSLKLYGEKSGIDRSRWPREIYDHGLSREKGRGGLVGKIKHITQLEIQHVRGISGKVFPVQIFPNKPNLLVAPNGFGKSSIACAFASLKPTKLEVPDDHRHGLEHNPQPSLSITYLEENGTTAVRTADETKNDCTRRV
ncbi:hypothetical protein CO661_09840 [Sinorhizobium fredii]|uniref:Uncharacterized protein n=1 Tax=Rhizobium fredii TaxID=380 RepID=A0A2A6M0X6_RHIFR|nr:hypothetical protein CO661_09840 [Sinorhizobium fredii]